MFLKKIRLFILLLIVIHCSSSNRTWSETKFPGMCIEEMVWGNGQFITIGYESGNKTIMDTLYAYNSPDGYSWSKNLIGEVGEGANQLCSGFYSLRYLNNTFTVWDSNGEHDPHSIAHSIDGINWIIDVSEKIVAFNDIAWDGSQYIGVGTRNDPWTSTDLILWTPHGGLTDYEDDRQEIRKIATNGSAWAGIGHDIPDPVMFGFPPSQKQYLYSSNDGINWTRQDSPEYFYNIEYVNNQFITMGPRGAIYISDDGISFENKTVFLGPEFYDVSYGSGEYIFLVNSHDIWSSGDLKSWQQYSHDKEIEGIFPNISITLNSIANYESVFVVAGNIIYWGDKNTDDENTGIILTSP